MTNSFKKRYGESHKSSNNDQKLLTMFNSNRDNNNRVTLHLDVGLKSKADKSISAQRSLHYAQSEIKLIENQDFFGSSTQPGRDIKLSSRRQFEDRIKEEIGVRNGDEKGSKIEIKLMSTT